MRIILLGPPGSGKGTQGELIQKKYGFPRIATGDLLRQAVEEGTPLGRKARLKMERGELVEDEIIFEMMRERLLGLDCKEGYVLDGFPRNLTQALWLEQIDEKREEAVLDIHLEDSVLIERLAARRICSSCGAIFNLYLQPPKKEGKCDLCGHKLIERNDDRPEVIRERLKVYHQQTEPLRDYYKKKGVYSRLDGSRKIEEVFEDICAILERSISPQVRREARK